MNPRMPQGWWQIMAAISQLSESGKPTTAENIVNHLDARGIEFDIKQIRIRLRKMETPRESVKEFSLVKPDKKKGSRLEFSLTETGEEFLSIYNSEVKKPVDVWRFCSLRYHPDAPFEEPKIQVIIPDPEEDGFSLRGNSKRLDRVFRNCVRMAA